MYITEKYLGEKKINLKEDYLVDNVIYKLEVYKFEQGNMWKIINNKDDSDIIELFTNVPIDINNLHDSVIVGRTINSSNQLKLENTYRNLIDRGYVEFTNKFSNIILKNFKMSTIHPNTELILAKPTGYKIRDGVMRVFADLGMVSTVIFGLTSMINLILGSSAKDIPMSHKIKSIVAHDMGMYDKIKDIDDKEFDSYNYTDEYRNKITKTFEITAYKNAKANGIVAMISFLLPTLSNFALRFIDSTLILKKIK